MSGPNLHVLHGAGEPDEAIVALARSLLQKAEAGEIVSLAAAYEYRNGDAAYWVTRGEDSMSARLIGQVEIMKGAMVRNALNGFGTG